MKLKIIATTLLMLSYHALFSQKDSSLLFEKSKGTLMFPVSNFLNEISITNRFDSSDLNYGKPTLRTSFVTKGTDLVSAIYNGNVSNIGTIGGSYFVITKFGRYFITYFGLAKPFIKRGQTIKSGQGIANVIEGTYSTYTIEIYLNKNKKAIDPYPWFYKRA